MEKFFEYFWGTIVAPANAFQRIVNEKSISVGRIPFLKAAVSTLFALISVNAVFSLLTR